MCPIVASCWTRTNCSKDAHVSMHFVLFYHCFDWIRYIGFVYGRRIINNKPTANDKCRVMLFAICQDTHTHTQPPHSETEKPIRAKNNQKINKRAYWRKKIFLVILNWTNDVTQIDTVFLWYPLVIRSCNFFCARHFTKWEQQQKTTKIAILPDHVRAEDLIFSFCSLLFWSKMEQ